MESSADWIFQLYIGMFLLKNAKLCNFLFLKYIYKHNVDITNQEVFETKFLGYGKLYFTIAGI